MLSHKAYMVKSGSRRLIQILNSAHLPKAVATEESRVCKKCPAAAAASTDSINCSAGHQDKEWKEGGIGSKFQVQLLIGNVRVCILRTTVTAREVSVRFGMRACQRWVANCTAADHGSRHLFNLLGCSLIVSDIADFGLFYTKK